MKGHPISPMEGFRHTAEHFKDSLKIRFSERVVAIVVPSLQPQQGG